MFAVFSAHAYRKLLSNPWTEVLLILFTTLLIYLPVLHFHFVWDDHYLITENPYLGKSIPWKEIFISPFWKFSSANVYMNYYRPIVTVSFFSIHRFFGFWEPAYHGFNVILHLSNVGIFWSILRFFAIAKWQRVFAISSYALHPVQVATVCFVSCQGDLLAMFFLLCALRLWMLESNLRWIALPVLFLSLLSKESTILTPILFVAYDLWFRRSRIFCMGSLFPVLLWLPYFVLRWFALQSAAPLYAGTPYVWNSYAGIRTIEYIGRILLPVSIAPDGQPPIASEFLRLMTTSMVLATFALFWILSRKHPIQRFFLLGFAFALIPIADLFTTHLRVSDQLLYTPLLFFLGLLAPLIPDRKVFYGLLTLVVFGFITRTLQEIPHWKNGLSLWSHAVELAPRNPLFASKLGAALWKIGEKEQSCQWIHRAYDQIQEEKSKMPPHTSDSILKYTLFNLGNCNLQSNPAKAELLYREQLNLEPDNFKTHYNLLVALIFQQKWNEAESQYEMMMDRWPGDEPLRELGKKIPAR